MGRDGGAGVGHEGGKEVPALLWLHLADPIAFLSLISRATNRQLH